MKRGLVPVLADVVDGLIEESEPLARLLIHNRSEGCPLRGTGTGATEGIEAGRYAGNVQIRQYAMENGRVVRDIGHGALMPTVKTVGAVLIRWLAEHNAESTAGRFGGTEKGLEVTKRRSFVPHDLAEIRPWKRMCSRIATQRSKAKVRCVQFGAAHARHQRIAGRLRNRLHPRVAVAGLQCRALVGGRGEQGDVRLRCGSKHVVVPREYVRVDATLVLAEAHRDDVAKVVVDRVSERAEDIGVVVRLGQYQDDVCAGGDGMRPFNVEADLLGPPRHVGVARDKRRETVRCDLGQVYRRETVKGFVSRLLANQIRILKGIDDDDCVPATVEPCGDQRVDLIGVSHLIRIVALPAGNG